MDVPEGVLGADQATRRLVSDAEDTPGLPGAQGGLPGGPALVGCGDVHADGRSLSIAVRGSDLHLRLVVAQSLVVQRCVAGLELPVGLVDVDVDAICPGQEVGQVDVVWVPGSETGSDIPVLRGVLLDAPRGSVGFEVGPQLNGLCELVGLCFARSVAVPTDGRYAQVVPVVLSGRGVGPCRGTRNGSPVSA